MTGSWFDETVVSQIQVGRYLSVSTGCRDGALNGRKSRAKEVRYLGAQKEVGNIVPVRGISLPSRSRPPPHAPGVAALGGFDFLLLDSNSRSLIEKALNRLAAAIGPNSTFSDNL